MNLEELQRETSATRVYAVGDIHGRLDLLMEIEQAIEADLDARPTNAPLICYLGDYVDRGPSSAGVIDHLASRASDGLRRVYLKGNHEDRMLAFLEEPEANGPGWMKFGGVEALASYGLSQTAINSGDWPDLRNQLATALPREHLNFLRSLDLAFRWGDYLFVHAGLNPARALADQDPHDLMWIREPFLSSERDWGLRVVHGHVIEPEPVFRANRIGLDTGAYQSGVLTCAGIEGGEVRILQAS
ncbi:MAG TPA: metallophosphoesterase family protein [Sphingomicrobium sp.]